MHFGRGGLVLLLFSALPLLVLGCGKSSDAGGADAQQKNVLTEIYEMYSVYVKKNQKPPQQKSDLTQKSNESINPAGVQGIQSGEYVVVYGTDPSATPDAVLAYHKDVPNSGGWVVLANSTVKKMTAAEFAAAPKAK